MRMSTTLLQPLLLALMLGGCSDNADVARTDPSGGSGGDSNTSVAGAGRGGTEGSGTPTTAEVELQRSDVAPDASPAISDGDYGAFIANANRFGLELMQAMVDTGALDASENQIFSPASALVALSMVYAGAGGDTAAEMQTVLHDELPAGAYHVAQNRLLRELASRAYEGIDFEGQTMRVELVPVNSLWLDTTVTATPTYLDLLSREYDTGIHRVDFLRDQEAARLAINAWVGERTHDRIHELLESGQVTAETRMALVNALYLYANWQRLFDTELTSDQPFQTLAGTEVTASTMHDTETLGYKDADPYVVVELPFVNGQLRLTLVLPDEGAFETVRGGVTQAWLEDATTDLTPTEVVLALPKFELESGQMRLGPALLNLGMPAVFGSDADFSGISAEPLFVSDVVQKAFIGTNEAGTEAAAATAVLFVGVASASPREVTLDRPFLFFIRDLTGLVLFSGQVVDPS